MERDALPSAEPSGRPLARRPLSRRLLSRRAALGVGGGGALALLVAACSSGSDGGGSDGGSSDSGGSDASSTSTTAAGSNDTGGTTATTSLDELSSGTPTTTAFTAADFAALGACLLSPEQTEGPFPTETQIERRDIRESLAGHPLRLGLQVVDESCEPIPGAMVEIWHCDTDGDYSAYADGATADDAAEGTTFLRGSQTSNEDGIVEFVTNYPGWYSGRAVHIHTKVHLDDTTVLTSQIFFDDDVNSEIFSSGPYLGDPDTTNAEDSISGGDPASNGTMALASDDRELAGTRALLVLGVDPDAVSGGGSAGPGGAPGGGGPGGQDARR